MPRGVKKENLPSKLCEVCKRPFTWRKVWERCWDDVKTCSDRCKAERKKQNKLANKSKEQDQEEPSTTATAGDASISSSSSSRIAIAILPSFSAMPPATNLSLFFSSFSSFASPHRFLSLHQLQCP